MNSSARYRYWRAVEECLVRFHDFDREKALHSVLDFQRKVQEGPEGLSYDLVFHIEPFDLANDLAGSHLKLSPDEYQKKYIREILAG